MQPDFLSTMPGAELLSDRFPRGSRIGEYELIRLLGMDGPPNLNSPIVAFGEPSAQSLTRTQTLACAMSCAYHPLARLVTRRAAGQRPRISEIDAWRRCPRGMLVQLSTAAVAACLVVTSPAAEACINEVRRTTDYYVGVLVRAEQQLEAGQYARARKILGDIKFPTAALEEREMNILAVLSLRSGDPKLDADTLVSHFKARTEAKETRKDVRHRAWLAEAYIAAGKPDEARSILLDLHKRDLMPDAYAYLALAKLSSGKERDEYDKACRARTQNKDLCELPAQAQKTSAQAQR